MLQNSDSLAFNSSGDAMKSFSCMLCEYILQVPLLRRIPSASWPGDARLHPEEHRLPQLEHRVLGLALGGAPRGEAKPLPDSNHVNDE